MAFKENKFNSATMEPGEDMLEVTKKLRKENEEKINKMKEKKEKHSSDPEESLNFGEKNKKTEEKYKKDEKDEEAFGEKENQSQKKDWKQEKTKKTEEDRDREKKKEEELNEKRKKFSKEFQKKTLNADKIKPEQYTKEMRDEDLNYLDEWRSFEIDKIIWLIDELFIEGKRRTELATSREQLDEIRKWIHSTKDQLHRDKNEIHKKFQTERKRVIDMFFYKKDSKKEEDEKKKKQEEEEKKKEKGFENEFRVATSKLGDDLKNFSFKNFKDPKWQKKSEDYLNLMMVLSQEGIYGGKVCETWEERLEVLSIIRRNIEDFLKKAEKAKEKAKKSRKKKGNEKKEEKQEGQEIAENNAINELGISRSDLENITGNVAHLGNNGIIRLTIKVLQTTNNKAEIKKAYRRCVREWHPDAGKSRYGIGVNEVKIKIANALYSEYKKRFGE